LKVDFILDVQKNYTYDLVPMTILSSLLLFFSRKGTVKFFSVFAKPKFRSLLVLIVGGARTLPLVNLGGDKVVHPKERRRFMFMSRMRRFIRRFMRRFMRVEIHESP